MLIATPRMRFRLFIICNDCNLNYINECDVNCVNEYDMRVLVSSFVWLVSAEC
jgi:hypothetical protein